MKYDLEIAVVGSLEENCYILTIDNNTYLIDPGDEPDKIEKYLEGKNLKAILVTHHHFDHIGALDYFENNYNLKHNTYIDDNFEIIKNPGHTSDSVSYYFRKLNIMFCGDFIFENSIGRMDLPTGNEMDMKNSLDMISNYDDNITLYPGHGNKTSLKKEKEHFKYYFNYN